MSVLTSEGWSRLKSIKADVTSGGHFDLVVSNSSIHAVHCQNKCIDSHGHIVSMASPCIRGLHHALYMLGNLRTYETDKHGKCLTCATSEEFERVVTHVRTASEDMDMDATHAVLSEVVSLWTVERMRLLMNAISEFDPLTGLRRFSIPDLITGQYVYLLYAMCGVTPSVLVDNTGNAPIRLVIMEQASGRCVNFFNEVRGISSYAYTGVTYRVETESPGAGIMAGLGSLIVI